MTASAQQLALLDDAYRRQQVAVQAATALGIIRLWNNVRADHLIPDATIWLNRAAPLVMSGFERSAKIGEAYYGTLRHLHVPAAKPFIMPHAEAPTLAQVKTSLWVTGVVGAQHRVAKIPGLTFDLSAFRAPVPDVGSFLARQQQTIAAGTTTLVREAMSTSGAAAAAASVRHVGNGGREQVKAASAADPKALGYVRITSGHPCYFCAMLASRGGVFKGDSFDASDARFEGPGTAKVHDSCVCTLRGLFSRNPAEVPELNQHFTDMWTQRGDGDPLTAFRQLYEGRAA